MLFPAACEQNDFHHRLGQYATSLLFAWSFWLIDLLCVLLAFLLHIHPSIHPSLFFCWQTNLDFKCFAYFIRNHWAENKTLRKSQTTKNVVGIGPRIRHGAAERDVK
jgi:1,4-dihydroxy-2-naphthoate octaprenyltransferase